MTVRILLQTTIERHEDDWHIGRFSLLRRHLESLRDEEGRPRFEVTARDRSPDGQGDDPVLSLLPEAGFDEIWLFAVDAGEGLSKNDVEGIARFWQQGGGVFTTRDHQDLGHSLIGLGAIGQAHFFHTTQPEPDATRHCVDDNVSTAISWPNYHSGANGDVQAIQPTEPLHPLLTGPDGQPLSRFPAHPHEGAVGVPEGEPNARVIATGTSRISGRAFNLMVAFERERSGRGRAIAESSFHHVCDYNWDPRLGCPSFVEEAPADAVVHDPALLDDIKAYVANVAGWLAAARPMGVLWLPEERPSDVNR